jgi:GntR family transcriptional regulator/MocR family aminotransferase
MWLALDGTGPLHRQAYRALRLAILGGALPRGCRLPSTRALARDAGLSRNTVLEAYAQLVAEGYAAPRAGSGTYVADTLPEEALHAERVRSARAGEPASGSRRNAAGAADGRRRSAWLARLRRAAPRPGLSWSLGSERLRYDFRYGEPSYSDLPITAWCRALARRARRAKIRELAYAAPGGAPELRRALAAYLARARGVACEPRQVIVTHGVQQGIDLAARTLIDPGERVAIEEPGYGGTTLALEAAGARLVPVPVDADGIETLRLARLAPVRLVCVTPSHQFPTGAVLPLSRRIELLAYAREHRAIVFEDDYDSEYRYAGRPIECLQGLDRDGRVVYAGTASKLLFPALRIGWLVAPPDLAPDLLLAKAACDTGSASLEQLALADFIESGQLERHVRRTRLRNAARRAALLDALRRELGPAGVVSGTDAGLHVLLWLPELPASETSAFRHRCREAGVGLYPASPYYRDPPDRVGYVLGYAALSEDLIREGIARLAACLSARTPPRGSRGPSRGATGAAGGDRGRS